MENEVDGECRTQGRDDKYVQCFGWATWRGETARGT